MSKLFNNDFKIILNKAPLTFELLQQKEQSIEQQGENIIAEDVTKHDDILEDFNEEEIEIIKELDKLSLESLVRDYQNGKEEVFDIIYKQYKNKLESLSRRQNDPELFSELIEVLWRAVQTFDDSMGAKFNTYYWTCARNQMGILKIRKQAKKRVAEHGVVSLSQQVVGSDKNMEIEDTIEDSKSDSEYDNILFNTFLESEIFPNLKESEINAIKMLIDGYTLEEIGNELGGITAPAVHIKLRRLANKKTVGKQFQQLYDMYY